MIRTNGGKVKRIKEIGRSTFTRQATLLTGAVLWKSINQILWAQPLFAFSVMHFPEITALIIGAEQIDNDTQAHAAVAPNHFAGL